MAAWSRRLRHLPRSSLGQRVGPVATRTLFGVDLFAGSWVWYGGCLCFRRTSPAHPFALVISAVDAPILVGTHQAPFVCSKWCRLPSCGLSALSTPLGLMAWSFYRTSLKMTLNMEGWSNLTNLADGILRDREDAAATVRGEGGGGAAPHTAARKVRSWSSSRRMRFTSP